MGKGIRSFDFIVLGGGMSGVSFARLAQLRGMKNFLVLEAESEPGGLCRSREINGHVLDVGGGHFLCTKYPEVYDFVFAHIPRSEFNSFERVSKIALPDGIVDYPLESNLWQLPEAARDSYLASIRESYERSAITPPPPNYEEWVRYKLGDRIADDYMLPYNRKIWGVPPAEMDIDWLEKIPALDFDEISRSALSRTADRAKMPSHANFYYPKLGGFQTIFDAIARQVRPHIQLETRVESIEKKADDWIINGAYSAKTVINTIAWPTLQAALGDPADLRTAFSGLRHNSIVVSLWERQYEHDWHWNYDPSPSREAHRNFFIHNFAPHSAPSGVYSETNVKRWPGENWSHGERPVYEYTNELAYPIPSLGRARAIRQVLHHYEPQRLFGLGRWGQWQYFNSDVCIREAMRLSKRLFA